MDKTRLLKLFIELVQIPSPSGREKKVAEFILQYLSRNHIKAEFDMSGVENNSNSGNIIAKIVGSKNQPAVLFVAHMDTVETGEKTIKPIISSNIITSDGTTILGADDKAAVACLLQVLEDVCDWTIRPTVIVVFTTREEDGKMGSSLLKLPQKIDYAFNIDGPNNLGDFVYQVLGHTSFKIKLIGKAAHAAVEPEKGINAIKAAALLITKLKIGKDEKGGILNVGMIHGGKANNIVPDEVVIEGEVRAYLKDDIDKKLNEVEEAIRKICSQTGCLYELKRITDEEIPPLSLSKNHEIVRIARKAAKTLNLPFSLIKGSFTSDANFLGKKYPTINICRGSKMPHSFEESITVDGLYKLRELISELIKQAIA